MNFLNQNIQPKKGNWFIYLLFCACLALNWYFHKDAVVFNDRSELWSDRAGYYIYLPATFFYHWDVRQMPPDLDVLTGAGFSLDTARNLIDTKYTYGVALMQSPFFLAARLVAAVTGTSCHMGFAMIFIRMMGLAAVVYLVLGLWLLKRALEPRFSNFTVLFTLAMIFLGTNLFYYSLIDGMMSHVYSFFLFAFFLYLLNKYLETGKYLHFLLLALVFALAVLVRPTNLMLGLVFLFWDSGPGRAWRRVRDILIPKNLLSLLAAFFLLFLPQLIYWKYLSGSWLHFSYGEEGFKHWGDPRIAEVLFSPVNGLFAYTPMALVFVAGILAMILRRRRNGLFLGVLFIAVTLVCASWSMWYFGCSYGQRSYIEYYVLFAFPFAFLTEGILKNNRWWLSAAFFFVVFLFAYFNLRFTIGYYRYERCYYGSTWDWGHYRLMLGKADILTPVPPLRSFENDFENLALLPGGVLPSKLFTRSGDYSIPKGGRQSVIPLSSTYVEEFHYPWPKRMAVDAWVFVPGKQPVKASLNYRLESGNRILFRDSVPLDPLLHERSGWNPIGKTFVIPDVYDTSLVIRLFLSNPQRQMLFVDNLRVTYLEGWD